MNAQPQSFLLLVSLCLCVFVPGVPTHAADQPPSPEHIRASLVLPEGLAAELVACEPQISSPVAMAFDESGVLFVVEMLDYPTLAKDQPPKGRIKRLEDRDGDGRYEHATVFADALPMANGLLPWRGGLIVTAAPHILYLKDADGDGISEAREIWFEGFAQQNPQLRSSHPILGLDNFIYVTNGAKGGKVRRANAEGAPEIALGQQDFRFDARDPRGGVYEAIPGYAQFGHTFDDWGRRFVCTNRNHWVHLPMEGRYFARNPALAAPPAQRDDQRAGGAAAVFPLSKNKTLAATHAGNFTAACGVFIYRSSALPDMFRGAIFTCEPTGNLVHAERLIPAGATFRGEPLFEKKEFLASPDTWFRPVNLCDGPDGAMYVVDFCRSDVEHPEWVPKHLQHRYDFEGLKDRGRIWRIVSKDVPQRREKPALRAASVETLVGNLDSATAWQRNTAQRLLLERNDHAAVPLLKTLATQSRTPQARVHALMLLNGFGALEAEVIQARLKDEYPGVRESALKLAEPFLSKGAGPLQAAVIACSVDGDARVRFQAALSLGACKNQDLSPLAEIARRDGADRWARLAVASAVPDFPEKLLALLLDPPAHTDMLREVAMLVGASKDRAKITETIGRLEKQAFATRSTVLLGVMDGMARRGERLEKWQATLPADTQTILQASVDQARTTFADAAQPPELRASAAKLLTLDADGSRVLGEALARSEPEALQLATLAALEAFPGEPAARAILPRLKTMLPAVRREALRVLGAHPQSMAEVLNALEKKSLRRADLDSETVRKLKNSNDAALRTRANDILKDPAAEDRQALLARYRAALATSAMAKNGRALFEQNCATCHRLGTLGLTVGPDISDTLGRDAEMLLNDILDPNAAIDTSFTAYTVKTKQGTVLNGLIATQNAASITLRGAGAKEDTVLTQDAAEIRSTGLSLMPEGFEQALTPEQMRDLIAYIRNWRDVEGK